MVDQHFNAVLAGWDISEREDSSILSIEMKLITKSDLMKIHTLNLTKIQAQALTTAIAEHIEVMQ
ncbi:hypothetical protein CJU29_23895 [Pseudomonas aeruginosa]|nr:hypothetical protein B0B22_01855 [Pseudomonas aeruginosa]PBV43368.1 hypothetical protein CJU29_23895 [Pseudomonas aeruginosa]PCB08157.1 hypothetical protein CJT95_29150 [Pseudomonas aeruginosa]RPU60445.1 hypothetical protein IPC886_30210 [Pseudomonas aeruginosa]